MSQLPPLLTLRNPEALLGGSAMAYELEVGHASHLAGALSGAAFYFFVLY